MVARPHFQKLVERARRQTPLSAAFVYPCDLETLQLALSGAFAGFLNPTLVGPEARIRDLADKGGLDISRLALVDSPDNPAETGERAAELARSGRVAALVKGSLSKEDLLRPVVDATFGLRTERRLSHACFLDLPGQNRGLLLSDAQMNVAPNLAAKRDIIQNAIQLAIALGLAAPSVALLAAMDGPAPAFRSTTDAVALKSMAAQGLFGTAKVDGPLAPDSALSVDAARVNGVKSNVAGTAEVLIAPSMESGLMVLRTMLAMGGGLAAGIVLGARVPIVMPTRTESLEVRMASCVLASLMMAAGNEALAPQVSPVAVAADPGAGSRVAA